jgi:hypothetical protein
MEEEGEEGEGTQGGKERPACKGRAYTAAQLEQWRGAPDRALLPEPAAAAADAAAAEPEQEA